jgi:hypothetical protein
MKKIIITPKTDTVTLCIPEEWVGKAVVCKLSPLPEPEKGEGSRGKARLAPTINL